MRRALLVLAALAGAVAIGRVRVRGDAPARSADLRLARVRRACARLRQDRRGQVRPRRRPRPAPDDRSLRVPHLRRPRPAQPQAARRLHAGRDPRRRGLLAGRGHGHRSAAQADHRGARPAPRRRRPDELPGHRHWCASGPYPSKNRNPKCRSGFYVISYADPKNLRQVGDFVELPAGHTTSCVDHCNYVWTGGPARREDLAYLGPFTAGGKGDGRPIWVTDLRNPAHPRVFEKPIDLGRTTASPTTRTTSTWTRPASPGSAGAAG